MLVGTPSWAWISRALVCDDNKHVANKEKCQNSNLKENPYRFEYRRAPSS
jgi:hypothetical protein